jgi:RNA polymerase sigma factor for flagellar operon FliA
MLDHVRRETHGRAHAARARAVAALAHVDESPLATESAEPTEESNRDHLRGLLAAEAGALFIGLTTAGSEPSSAAADPEEALVRERAKAALRGALDALPERDRGILERHYYKGEPFEAIAQTMGLSKSWLSRIHSRLLAGLGVVLAEH